ncbi:uncharacterized protein BcabD6B2_11670 [Babesia caballi]|uniref:Uncharacterized protein n=1 Tax=Babesia caballi TaxID=5871 RepID=A0AAV4LNB9_BABCB|nr:hypothetical protein, conserved [Babesia caballi]
MRTCGVLLAGLAFACAASCCDVYVPPAAELSLLERPFGKSSKKNKGGSRKRSKDSDDSSVAKKKRRFSLGAGKKNKKRDALDSRADGGAHKKKKRRFSLFGGKKSKSKKEKGKRKHSWFSRKNKDEHEAGQGSQDEHGTPHHKRKFKELTEDLHEQIERDQHEPTSVVQRVSEDVHDISSNIKDRLMSSISKDVDAALHKLEQSHESH